MDAVRRQEETKRRLPSSDSVGLCYAQFALRVLRQLAFVLLRGMTSSGTHGGEPLFHFPCGFAGSRYWLVEVFLQTLFSRALKRLLSPGELARS